MARDREVENAETGEPVIDGRKAGIEREGRADELITEQNKYGFGLTSL